MWYPSPAAHLAMGGTLSRWERDSSETFSMYYYSHMRAEADIPGIVDFSHRMPGKPLSDFVNIFWYWTGHPQPLVRERILPIGSVELVIKLNSPRTSDSGMTGPSSESFLIERRATDELLGVHFKPGGAFPFLGFSYSELHNSQITLAELWGERLANRLLCLLNEAPTGHYSTTPR